MNKWPIVKLGNILRRIERDEKVDAEKSYNLLGIRLEGRGPFLRESVMGVQTSATKLFRVEKDDFIYSRLFACRGAFGTVSQELSGCYVSNEFPTFTPVPDKLDVEFLKYWFMQSSILKIVDADCTGSTPLTRNRYKEKFFLALEIPLPPLAEQRRIVARIEELTAQIDEARELRRHLIKDVDALNRTGIFYFFKQLSNVYPKRSLGDIVTIRGGGTPSKANPFYWSGRIPWITPKDMKSRVITDSIDHISECASQESPAKVLQAGAVLVVVRGMILVHTFPSAVLNTTATINQDMKALIPNEKILPEFLCTFFWANNTQIIALVEKSTHDTRKLETIKLLDIQVPVPPLSEQQRIVAELDAVQSEINGLKYLQAETENELVTLLPAVLDRAFKGKL